METDCGSKTNEIEAQGLDLHLCIICQRKKNENLVEKPEAHEKVWVSIEEWSKYGNLQYTEVWNKLRLLLSKSLRMGGHHGIDHVIKMQYMLECLDEQEKGMRGSSKAPMSPGENHDQIHP